MAIKYNNAIDDDNGILDQSGSCPANHALWA